MKTRISLKWIIYTLAGILAGCAFAYGILLMWILFTWLILGYGDSGPSWIIQVNNIIIGMGLFGGFLLAQILYLNSRFK